MPRKSNKIQTTKTKVTKPEVLADQLINSVESSENKSVRIKGLAKSEESIALNYANNVVDKFNYIIELIQSVRINGIVEDLKNNMPGCPADQLNKALLQVLGKDGVEKLDKILDILN